MSAGGVRFSPEPTEGGGAGAAASGSKRLGAPGGDTTPQVEALEQENDGQMARGPADAAAGGGSGRRRDGGRRGVGGGKNLKQGETKQMGVKYNRVQN